MAIEVFNRYENKYLLDERTFYRLRRRLSDFMELDPHNREHGAYAAPQFAGKASQVFPQGLIRDVLRRCMVRVRYLQAFFAKAHDVFNPLVDSLLRTKYFIMNNPV